jgi:hypothetical protein
MPINYNNFIFICIEVGTNPLSMSRLSNLSCVNRALAFLCIYFMTRFVILAEKPGISLFNELSL